MQTQLRLAAALFCFSYLPEAAQAQTNTATGVEALLSNTTGTANTATGYRALRNNTIGSRNTAIGYDALWLNITGGGNTASGYRSLASNTTGDNNTASGFHALFSNTTGFNNTASGSQALFSNTTGIFNTAMGSGALGANTTGNVNTAFGSNALGKNTVGGASTAIGESALTSNTTGNQNTATGFYALRSNTTGMQNTAAGYNALQSNTVGQENTAYGTYASYHSTTGYFNTSSGTYALFANGSGVRNTASGATALAAVTTGLDNTGMGTGAGFSFNHFQSTFVGSTSNATVAVNNSTALGYGTIVSGDNQIRIGNTAVTSIGGGVNWTTFSDGRYKKNAKEDVPGLSFITKLRPLTYSLDVEGIDQKLTVNKPKLSPEGISEKSKLKDIHELSGEEKKARVERSKVVYIGFVAQEVQEAAKALNYDFSGVDKPKNKDDFYGLRYGDFVVPLVKAVQEQQQQIEELKQQNKELKELVTKLLDAKGGRVNNTTTIIPGAYLKQNVPNPHNGATVINYNLPQGTARAQMVISNSKGQVLKTVALNNQGNGQLTLNAGLLPAGTYTYSLWIDGRQADVKQMVIVK